MEKDKLRRLVKKYLAGSASATEKAVLEAWYDSFEEEKEFPMDPDTLHDTEVGLFELIKARRVKKRSVVRKLVKWTKLAAIWLCLISFSVMLYTRVNTDKLPEEQQVEQLVKAAPKGQVIRFNLPDGTMVWLNGGSTLYFPETFSGVSREIMLTGEAYFEVTAAPERPFIVYTGDLRTEVLGTAFNVSSYEALQTAKVSVANGKVAVSVRHKQHAGSAAIHLTPNQQLIFDKQDSSLLKEGVDVNSVIGWRKGNYEFRDVPLKEVALKLENRFNVSISIENKKLAEKRITAAFDAGDRLPGVLEAFRQTTGLRYEFLNPGTIRWY